jgi:PAS domain S-box-containing protein
VNEGTSNGNAAHQRLSFSTYQALFENHPHAVAVVDPQGTLVAANPAARWLGDDANPIFDRAVGSPTALSAWRRAIAEGHGWAGQLELTDAEGRPRAVGVQVLAASPTEPVRLCVMQPVTPDVAALPSRDAGADVRDAADIAPALIWMAGVDGRCEWFNRPWRDFTGRSLSDLQGDGWLGDVHPEDAERCVAIFKTSFDARQPFSMDYRLRRHDGQYRWFVENGVPRHDRDGAFNGYIGCCVDIHERKELEERLADHAQAMRLADRRQNEFLAMLSHQLRSPLAPISNAASVLRTMEEANPTVQRLREIIERQVGRLRRLVDDLVDVTRVMQGEITLVKGRVSVRDLLRSATETSQSKLDAAGHTLRVDLPSAPLWVTGDSVRLAQALSNILSNAATFTPQPSVISVSAKATGDTLNIAIRDEGQGITAEFLPYVFDLFSRHDLQSGGNPGGLGLGLPLARRVAQLHGGDVKAFSEGPGRGAEFVMSLPLAAADQETLGTGMVPPGAASYRVLLIEDNPDTRYLMRLQIELWGHQVAAAGTVDESLRLIDGFRPEVVLCDIEGPEVSTRRGIDALRGRLGGQAVFVALSGYGHNEGEANARALGFDTSLVKPLRPDSLARTVEPLMMHAG